MITEDKNICNWCGHTKQFIGSKHNDPSICVKNLRNDLEDLHDLFSRVLSYATGNKASKPYPFEICQELMDEFMEAQKREGPER